MNLDTFFLLGAFTKAGKRIKITVFNMSLGILLFNHDRKNRKFFSVWKPPFPSPFVTELSVVTVNVSCNGKTT